MKQDPFRDGYKHPLTFGWSKRDGVNFHVDLQDSVDMCGSTQLLVGVCADKPSSSPSSQSGLLTSPAFFTSSIISHASHRGVYLACVCLHRAGPPSRQTYTQFHAKRKRPILDVTSACPLGSLALASVTRTLQSPRSRFKLSLGATGRSVCPFALKPSVLGVPTRCHTLIRRGLTLLGC